MWGVKDVSSDGTPAVVLIFARAPIAGTVKTRLRVALTEQQALSLHLAFLQDTIEKVRIAQTEALLYLTSLIELPFQNSLRIEVQRGNHLGERMQDAFSRTLPEYSKVIIIGTDSPTFPPEQIHKAAIGLEEHDVVLGPCEDGGYYLIAMKSLLPEAFIDIPWGTPAVLKNTLKALSAYSIFQLESYFDVDQPEDLGRLRREVESNDAAYLRYTRRWLESNPSAR